MSSRPLLLGCLLAAMIVIGDAETMAQAASGDQRLIDYRDSQLASLQVVAGRSLTVRFPRGERVRSASVTQTTWRVAANRRDDAVTVTAPADNVSANLIVVTDQRSYTFSLLVALAGSEGATPKSVQLRYVRESVGAAIVTGAGTAVVTGSSYRLRGDTALWPLSVIEDGARTYIEWSPDTPLPAVYAVDRAGREALVNGNMRDGRYVIDAVEPNLVFRIDRRRAVAIRVAPQGARR